jgi:isoquinoline 1-oxidoreductase beta subunit
MTKSRIENASRRAFLKAGTGLSIGVCLAPAAVLLSKNAEAGTGTFAPNAFLHITEDNVVTVIAKHAEIGQGVFTGLATLVAEELDAAWSQVRVEAAPADARHYANSWMPGLQLTGGSTSMPSAHAQMRQAGAAARQMLVAAASKRWKVPVNEVSVKEGVVSHAASGRKLSFGQLAGAAAQEQLPTEVKLKSPKDFRLIGKQHLQRKDGAEKTNGRAIYGLDIRLPGMLVAVVAYPPRIGATAARFDADRSRAIPGVVDVVAIPAGIAVVAKNFWSARKGREALTIDWDESKAFPLGTAEIFTQYRALLPKPGVIARKEGDWNTALQAAPKKLGAVYELPYLAHATMEPMDCVVRLGESSCELWNGEQVPTLEQTDIAKVLGLLPEQVTIHSLFAGGSFGRRYVGQPDYVIDAVMIAKALGKGVPVKLVRTREDDMRAGFYRPLYVHGIQGALDAKGNAVAWQHRVIGQSVVEGTYFGFMVKDGVDSSTLEGAVTLPYAIPNLMVDLHNTRLPVTVNSMRSVGSFHNAFVVESFIDELANAAGRDPLEFRLSLLQKQPRFIAVLKLVAEKSGWTKPLKPGQEGERRGRGLAVHQWQHDGTIVAYVIEVTVQPEGSFRVDRVVGAVDCGLAINPDIVRDQVEGGIGFGLSAALMGEITLKAGRVEQGNFDDYPVLRIHEMPRVDVHIVASADPPKGIGEPPVPPVAPALGNALFAATGVRLRRQPFAAAELRKS